MIKATSCGGVVIFRGKILLLFKNYKNRYEGWVLPKGTVEEGEDYAACCERELLEETGMKVKATEEQLEIEELFLDWRHINHYFVCEYVEDTGKQNLTEGEKEAGYERRWIDLDEAIKDFGDYERFHETDIADYGLYRREYRALTIFKKQL